MADDQEEATTTPPQAAAEAENTDTADAGGEEDLSGKSIKELRAIAVQRQVDLTGCVEKRDIVERIAAAPAVPVAASAAAAPAAPGPNAHAFNFNLGAAAAASDSDDDDDDDDDDAAQHEDMLNILPPCIVRRVEKLRELNSQRETIVEQYQKERAALEKKFADLYQPLFDERKETIAGKYDREIDAKAKKDGNENEEEDAQETLDIKGIPQFWVCAMGHMEAVAELITEADVDCLENLTDVQCIDDEDGMGFALEFHFKPNTYFSNTVLRKKYTIPNLLLDDEPILKNVEGDEIKWKEGMCLTHREIKKKQRAKSGKNAGKIRTIVKKEKQDSFFHFFKPPKIPTMDEMDEEEADAIEQAFDVDYDVAQAFRSHIIPKAALWFTGEALDEGFDIAEGEWPGEEEGDDEDGDGGAEGGDAAAAAAAAAPSGNSPFPPPAEGEENPECKQN